VVFFFDGGGIGPAFSLGERVGRSGSFEFGPFRLEPALVPDIPPPITLPPEQQRRFLSAAAAGSCMIR